MSVLRLSTAMEMLVMGEVATNQRNLLKSVAFFSQRQNEPANITSNATGQSEPRALGTAFHT